MLNQRTAKVVARVTVELEYLPYEGWAVRFDGVRVLYGAQTEQEALLRSVRRVRRTYGGTVYVKTTVNEHCYVRHELSCT